MSCFQEAWDGSCEDVTMNATTKNAREQLDSTKESYNGALRDLRQDRISWKAEKREWRDFRKRVGAGNDQQQQQQQQPIPKKLQIKHLMKEKKRHESHLNSCADQIQGLRETVVTVRLENQGLRGQLDNFKANNQATVIRDLEDEVSKWEVLYTESAKLGAARMSHLEQELTKVRSSSRKSKEIDSLASKQIDTLYEKLKATFAAAKAKKEELKQYKQKSRQRVSLLKEMLEQAKEEKEKELMQVKAQQEDEISLLDTIEQLEGQLSEQGETLERERAAAAKIESELKMKLKVARKLAYLEDDDEAGPDEAGGMQDFCSIFAKKIGEQLCGCGCMYDAEAEKRRVHNQVPILQ
jgi:chromosome segregation ATPase